VEFFDQSLLQFKGDVTWTRDAEALHIRLGPPPAPLPAAVAFRIRFK